MEVADHFEAEGDCEFDVGADVFWADAFDEMFVGELFVLGRADAGDDESAMGLFQFGDGGLEVDEGGAVKLHDRREEEDDGPFLCGEFVNPEAEAGGTEMVAAVVGQAVEAEFGWEERMDDSVKFEFGIGEDVEFPDVGGGQL